MPSIEDVYSKFGFVAEAAQLLETELGTLLFYEEATNANLIDKPDSKLATSIYKKINKHTLGKLINNTKSKINSVEKLESLLASSLIERNRLSHSFYREHNFRLRAKLDDGRIIMLEDLDRMHEIILDAYKAVMLVSGIDLENPDTQETAHLNNSFTDHVKL